MAKGINMAKRPITICHVQTTFNPGGLENGVANVVNGLDPDRFRSKVICLHERGALADRIVNPAAEVISLEHPDRLAPELPLRLAKLFRKLKPDIVHARNYTPNLYASIGARLARVPVLINGEHGMVQLIDWRKRMVSKFMRCWADQVLCVSPGLREFLYSQLNYPPNSVHVIINGVNLDRFSTLEADGMARRRELGIPEDVWLLGTVSRFYGFKDHPAMLSFLERVKEVDGKPVHAVIIGDGADVEKFRADRDARGLTDRVHMPGFQQNIHEYYSMFDLFCLLSMDNEGTSNVILEAMAADVPILTTAIEGNRHLIRDGWNGVIVPPIGEPKIDAMEKLIPTLLRDSERLEELKYNARIFVNEQFSLRRMIGEYEDFYTALHEGRPVS
ncbi:MAG: glycosyltransferase [bacterium]|nr:glycosyltransferase [bacterium]